ncbi:choice-of-anchor O protein [Shewanella ulleungensis]|jgi:hypothetical protein|uniref:Exo-alpha-sialidase n=1 Tax=Shewanella ulleungensis TaxID=2282699 RepID=A0ABQ2QGU7_9GAMM|nr:choice-of-anchor O protein [Shewanella ulleungensis]MCL1149481.1 choice-of-anchor O protein [Shewanella ulleungensis]GGP79347.1 hypothetical protein GCM10009410_09820 [Shewanella ulleungensis]
MKFKRLLYCMAAAYLATATCSIAFASDVLAISPQDEGGVLTEDLASKGKIVRLPNGDLVSAYAYGNSQSQTVYDVKAQKEHPAQDIFIRVSKDDGISWSLPVNISDTARKISKKSNWVTDGNGGVSLADFYGDSGKPSIFAASGYVAVTWDDKYCPAIGTDSASLDDDLPDYNYHQGASTYIDRDGRQLPFSCTYIAYTKNPSAVDANNTPTGGTWKREQLSFGERDAKQNTPHATTYSDGTKVAWNVSWQEDPEGLKTGDADGPGDGASGANVNKGTDIWYTYIDDMKAPALADISFAANVSRVTNNFKTFKKREGDDVVTELTGYLDPVCATKPECADNQPLLVETGKEGASRANLGLVQVPGQKPVTIIAYEETKGGGEGVDFGKVVRYHRFTFDNPPASYINVAFSSGLQKGGSSTDNSQNQNQPGAKGNYTDDGTVYSNEDIQNAYPDTEGVVSDVYQSPDWEDPARIGCVLSNPGENARRVRFFYNQVAGMDEAINQSGTKLMVFWKEGAYDQGGPSDIMGRIGVVGEDATNTGLTPLDFTPVVDTSFTTFTRYVLTSTGTVVYPNGVGGYVDGIGNVVDVADGDAVLDVTYEEAGGCHYYLTDNERDSIPPVTLSDRINNSVAINLSTNAIAEVTTDDTTKTIEALSITTENNNLEDARAHRGAINGDIILFGYSYTSDWALAKYTTEDNYNFFTRRSYDGGHTWTGTQNMTNYLPAFEVDIKEPRIVGAPNSTSACDVVNAPDGENCQDPNTFILAWGSIKNTLAHIGTGTELDVFVTKTRDGGRTYEPLKLLSANITVPLDPEGEADFESQLRMKPNGDNLYAVWMESSTDAAGYEDTVVRYRAEADLEDAGAPVTILDDGTAIYNITRPITVDQGSVTGLVVSKTTATGTEYTYPMPQFSYNVTGLAEGSTIVVTINFGSSLPDDFVLLKVKADGTTVEVNGTDWDLIGDNLIQVSITDGGDLDEDGMANGTIVDPVTVGVLVPTTTTSGSSSGGSVGFIELLWGVFGLLLTRRRFNSTRH